MPQYGMTFLERIPDQVLTHLRILAETVTSYIAVGEVLRGRRQPYRQRVSQDTERQHYQLFIAQYFGEQTDLLQRPADCTPPSQPGSFVFLCECVFVLSRLRTLRSRILSGSATSRRSPKWSTMGGATCPQRPGQNVIVNRPRDMDELANFAEFCEALVRMDVQIQAEYPGAAAANNIPLGENKGFDQPGFDTWDSWYSFTRKYALAFVRKCLVLLYVKYGVDFNSHVSPNPEQDELDRLTEALRLPRLMRCSLL